MSWQFDHFTTPAYIWMKELHEQRDIETVKRCIGNCNVVRQMLHVGYLECKKDIDLSLMPMDQKRKLWDESLLYCAHDRVEWCEAVRFYEAV